AGRDDDRNRRCCGRRRKCCAYRTCCYNYRYLTTHKVSRKCCQAIVLTVRPAIFNRQVLPFDVACFGETLTERAYDDRAGRTKIEKSDYRHPRTLRARSERPDSCCAAQCEYEFP